MSKKNTFNQLPLEVQTRVKNILEVYDSCTVRYYNGEYEVSPHSFVLKYYPNDYKVVADFRREEIFTDKEIMENYINNFHGYPSNYKGKKDFSIIKKMQEDKEFNKEEKILTHWIGKINSEGNFELTEKINTRV